MKKICFVLLAVFLTCFFLSCESKSTLEGSISYSKADYTLVELGRLSGLDEDTEWQIVQAYYKKLQGGGRQANLTINDVWVDQYYGAYCPYYLFPKGIDNLLDFLRTDYLDPQNHTVVAVKVGVTGMDYYTEPRDVIIKIPGYNFSAVVRHYDKSTILLWDKGQLYDMEKDFDYSMRPLLPACDYRKIINRYNGLDFETEAMIRVDFGKSRQPGLSEEEYAFMNINYLGTYNGYAALGMYSGASLLAVFQLRIDGVLFFYPSRPIHIFAWKEGQIYELQNLFEQSLITHEDLVEMAYFHHAGQWAWEE
jgi:hypothetical protein